MTDIRPPSLTERLRSIEATPTLGAALELFDDAGVVESSDLIGTWEGSGVPTGSPLDGLLESFGWHGKRFDSLDDVHPLVFGRGSRLFSVNPTFAPMRTGIACNRLLRNRLTGVVARAYVRMIRTTRPTARVRMMEYRGVVTATMSYDTLPINDHFRRIDENTLLGLMDYRFTREPFTFVLRRETAAREARR